MFKKKDVETEKFTYNLPEERGDVSFSNMTEKQAEDLYAWLCARISQRQMKDALPALGLVQDPKTNRYNLVKIMYNLSTYTAKIDEVMEAGITFPRSRDFFKRMLIKLDIINK